MSAPISRRALLGASAGAALTIAGRAALAQTPKEIVVPVAFAVAQRTVTKGGRTTTMPVVSRAFLDDQLAQANTIFADFAIRFVINAEDRTLAEEHAELDDRADRDALADSMWVGVANVFFVQSLRDIDDPKVHRMGVCWRKLSNLKKKYIIVAASARATTMAHELGHFLGNGHSSVKNNLMSYDRDGAKVFLDDKQGAKSRRTATALLATKSLVAVKA